MEFYTSRGLARSRTPDGLWEALGLVTVALLGALLLLLSSRRFGVTFIVIPLATFAAIAGLVASRVAAFHPYRSFGAANSITLARGAAAAILAGIVAEKIVSGLSWRGDEYWMVLAIAVPAVVLDGVDGFLARRSGLASAFGARFDMEIDALFLLVLSVGAAASEVVGPWVILIGVMRYAFWVAGFAFPWLFQPLPPSLRRKAVCVAEFVLILSALAPIAHPVAPAFAATALILLAWSFAIDIVWAAQRRGAEAAAEAA